MFRCVQFLSGVGRGWLGGWRVGVGSCYGHFDKSLKWGYGRVEALTFPEEGLVVTSTGGIGSMAPRTFTGSGFPR